jgi:DNA-binding NarL/FixJ family response regulator
MTPGELVDALERIHAGEIVVVDGADDPEVWGDWPGRSAGLSQREAEIIALITRGLSNEEIAKALYLSINTVKSYIRTAYRKMGVTSRSRAILCAMDRGFTTHTGAPPVDATDELQMTEPSQGPESGPSPWE